MNTTEHQMKEFVLADTAKLQLEKKAPPVYFESSGEFTLPDYMEPMQKILRMESKVLSPALVPSGGEVQAHGSELHSLIYVGASGEVCATVLPTDYRFAFPAENAGDPCALDVAETNVTYRLLGPRKISIRAKSAAAVSFYPVEDLAPTITAGGHEDSVCRLKKSLRGCVRSFVEADDLRVDDRVDAPQEAKPVWCGATAAVTDVRVTGGDAQIRGDVYAKVLFSVGDRAEMVEKKIRFDTAVPLGDGGAESAFAKAEVQSTEVSEAGGAFTVEAALTLRVCGERTEEVSLCEDAFSTFAPTETERRPISLAEPLMLRQGVYTASGSATGAPQDALRVVDTTGKIKIGEASLQNGKITVRGQGDMQAIYATENGYGCCNFTLPLEISADAAGAESGEVDAIVEVVGARTRIDGDRLICDVELSAVLSAARRQNAEAVTAVTLREDAPYAAAKHTLCILFPKAGETLWSVAKRSRTLPERIQRDNRLPEGLLAADAPLPVGAPLIVTYK